MDSLVEFNFSIVLTQLKALRQVIVPREPDCATVRRRFRATPRTHHDVRVINSAQE
jgi:hypothetical protein